MLQKLVNLLIGEYGYDKVLMAVVQSYGSMAITADRVRKLSLRIGVGTKIDAIKAYRELNPMAGLKESKEWVEDNMDEFRK